jgi:pentatricopeptide repeat protein
LPEYVVCDPRRLKHYRFLRPAASLKAVKQAMRFVQLLPRQYTDARTYNMLLRVCAEAGDLRNAMHVADMLQAAGLRMDPILYTTLISSARAAQGGGGVARRSHPLADCDIQPAAPLYVAIPSTLHPSLC